MGTAYSSILPEHAEFVSNQKMFFVGTAAAEGHVNLSPKGHDAFRILSPNQVAYLDLTGSGNETSAHLTATGRITFMFVAFEGKPLILRLYGTGRVVLPSSPEWEETAAPFQLYPGYRQIIVADIDIVKTSCGFSIPYYSYEGERDLLLKWAANQGEEKLVQYRANKNSTSMDGYLTPIGAELATDEE
ncbi:pyridoxamine 5'-phosphate oxidase family protein [Paenibacillus sp. BC26]|uniref:pyridoxamine 5'-phosphate oxidase family protein n=1 Tax=Paenibacillus sp. BC26 TaxID=1881032 RepID=UPI0008DF3BCD|nr:pyridoxamine 5'-phosphate oxidase family protein [Paenibacillus sp. BC26]SFS59572.1 Pyridoxamine 5'-phosphate oxidase [Paenibacillus sp. BC26]